MTYHVFISYAREDSEFCGELYETLTTVFDLQVYRDTEQAAAGDFTYQIKAALQTRPQPTFLVIASRHAVASEWVTEELKEYYDAGGPGDERLILFIELDEGAVGGLERVLKERHPALAHVNLATYQRIELADRHVGVDEYLVNKLWLGLSGRVQSQALATNRRNAEHWWRQQIPEGRPDFWGVRWRNYVQPLLAPDSLASRALIAQSGSGKSVVAAHFVHELLAARNTMPVVLTDLETIEPRYVPDTICQAVGVPTLRVLPAHVHRLASKGTRTVFVLDGLDRIGRDPEVHSTFVKVLRALAAASTLLVTCRSEFWEDEFDDLGIDAVHVRLLNGLEARELLRRYLGPLAPPYVEIFRTPFFLDATLQTRGEMLDAPDSETAVLEGLWRLYGRPHEGAVPEASSPQETLYHLAAVQLQAMTYSVPRAEVEDRLARDGRDAETALDQLRARAVLIESVVSGHPVIRLRHDLLDCFGILQLLLDPKDGFARRQVLYSRAADDIGWSLLASAVQTAHDKGNDALLVELFGALLDMLDRKRLGSVHMARSWAATYTLRSKFSVLMPLVLDCLDGLPTDSVQSANERASCTGPEPRVTREAASSLASAFAVIDEWQRADPDRAVPVLAKNLLTDRWPRFRRRFIEALAVYRRRDALEALEAFARREIDAASAYPTRADFAVFPDIANALAAMGDSSIGTPLLKDIIALVEDRTAGLDVRPATRRIRVAAARARRSAADALNQLGVTFGDASAFSEPSDDELLESLRPQEFGVGGSVIYTDWRIVQWAARLARRRLVSTDLNPNLLNALVEALLHEHTRVRTAVVESLAHVDNENSREAIIATLMEDSLPNEVRRACLEALRVQVSNPRDSVARAARRWALLSAAQRANRDEVFSVADDLYKLFQSTESGGLQVTDGAFECVDIRFDAHLETSLTDMAEVDAAASSLITAADQRAVGAGLENKYRISRIDTTNPSIVRVELAESSWQEGAGFHLAMQRLQQTAPEQLDGLVTRWLRGASLPGIAAVHGVVITSDAAVVLAQRPGGTPYAPWRWSATFEEQLTDHDLEPAEFDAFTAAARRGFGEELGEEDTITEIRYLGATLGMPSLGPAILTVVRTSDSFDRLRRRWRARGTHEVVDLDRLELSRLSSGGGSRGLHPTTQIRLDMLARSLRARQ